jgi:hypothetical protein
LYMCIDLYQKVKRTVTIPRNLLLQKKFLWKQWKFYD